jgi:alpha,alpha-trehalase
MSELSSLVDVKVKAEPVLYLPAGFAVSAAVAELLNKCIVEVRSLPMIIQRVGDVKPEHLPSPGLLYLPNPYAVPGGRFNEMYGWDSYFTVLGLLSSGLFQLAKGMVDNLLFEIEHYGAVLNANRTYYLTRSQPPFLTAMMRAICECRACFSNQAARDAWIMGAYRLAARYYETWTEPYRLAGETGLSRYFDLDTGPVPELADHSTYYRDVIGWFLDHPAENQGYLVGSPGNGKQSHNPQHGDASCDLKTGLMRDPPRVKGFCLTEEFYSGDRAMRESGFDSSFRFGPFCGSTHHFAPVCLNSLLFRYECDMANFARGLRLSAEEPRWRLLAKQRSTAIHRYMWRADEGLFQDYDFIKGENSKYRYSSIFYALWAGLATREQAILLRQNLSLFERPGGLAMSETASGLQCDEPYGWAPCNWIAVEGLRSYGYLDDARRIARAFVGTVDQNFERDGTIREKYDVVKRDAEVHITAGYKQNVIGFGWTSGVYLRMQELLAENA